MTTLDDIGTPPGMDPWDLLLPATHSGWVTEPSYRRYWCEHDLVMFMYTYMFHHLSSPETGGRVSFARHHLAMARATDRWAEPGPQRDIVIAPRGSAKSTWAMGAILKSLAYGQRRLAAAVGASDQAIGIHMATIRQELAENALLLNDFPGLRPTRRNNASLVVTRSGAAIAAGGLDGAWNGLKVDSNRPDIIWLDDLEPDESTHTAAEAKRRLGAVHSKLLPMNDRAAAIWTGTVTMFGSILHSVVLGYVGEEKMPAWILDGLWKVHYVPGLQTDEGGRERSYWETRHPLAELQRTRRTHDFLLNTQGRPPHPGAAANMWRPELIQELAEPVRLVDRGIWVDVAVSGATLKRRHDYMAVCVAGRYRDKAVLEYARQFKMTGGQLLELLGDLCDQYPDVRTVNVEANQGGELWREILSPMPTGVTLVLRYAHEKKSSRIVGTRGLLRHYEREQVIHAYRLPELEADLLRYPAVEHDDLVDVTAAAVADLLADAPS